MSVCHVTPHDLQSITSAGVERLDYCTIKLGFKTQTKDKQLNKNVTIGLWIALLQFHIQSKVAQLINFPKDGTKGYISNVHPVTASTLHSAFILKHMRWIRHHNSHKKTLSK